MPRAFRAAFVRQWGEVLVVNQSAAELCCKGRVAAENRLALVSASRATMGPASGRPDRQADLLRAEFADERVSVRRPGRAAPPRHRCQFIVALHHDRRSRTLLLQLQAVDRYQCGEDIAHMLGLSPNVCGISA